jgi:type I restriction enzyme S subunit
LGEVCNFGVNESIASSAIKDNEWLLDLEDIEKDTGKILVYKNKKERTSISTRHRFVAGNVLYSKLRPYLNKVVVVEKNGCCTSEILPLDFGNHIYNRFAQMYLMSPTFVQYTVKCSYGVKMPRLGTRDGMNALFLLPPFAEQQCIVKKAEELLQGCDRLN